MLARRFSTGETLAQPEPRAQVVLVDNRVDYYAQYLRSLLEPAGDRTLSVMTRHGPLTGALLGRARLQVLDEAPRPDPEAIALARRLQTLVEAEDMTGINAFHAELRERLLQPALQDKPALVLGVRESAGLAVLRALADRRPFLAVRSLRGDAVQGLAAQAATLFVVIERITDDDVVWLQRILAARGRHVILDGIRACPVGLLHARTFDTMTLLDAKQRASRMGVAAPGPSLFVDCYLEKPPEHVAPDTVVVPYGQVDREYVAAHQQVDLLAITAHGMSDLSHLNDDYLCGKSAYLGSEDLTTGRLPSCMDEEGTCFFKPLGRPLLARELTAAHVFINSCGSLRFHASDFDPLFNVGYAILESRAISFLGTIRFKDGHGAEGLLYHHLLRRGFTLGETAWLLNLALFSQQLEGATDVFYLIGDPSHGLAQPDPRPEPQPLREGVNRVQLQHGFGLCRISSPELTVAYRRAQLLIKVDGRTSVHTAIAPGSDPACLYVFLLSYEDLTAEAVVRVHRLSRIAAQLAQTRRLIDENLGYSSGLTSLYPERVRQGGKKNLDNRLVNLARLYKSAFTDPDAVGRFLLSWAKLEEDLARTDLTIAGWLAERISTTFFRFGDQYQDTFLLEPEAGVGTCEVCGSEAAIRVSRQVLSPSSRRVQRNCPRCGVIEDRPDGAVSLHILAPDRTPKRSTVPVRLRFVNDSEVEYQGYCLAAVRNGNQFNIRSTPVTDKITVQPKGLTEVRFTVELDGRLPIHRYTLQAALVSSTRVFLAARPFLVVDPSRGSGA